MSLPTFIQRLQRQALKLKERLKKEGKLDFQKTDPYFTDENLLDCKFTPMDFSTARFNLTYNY